MLSFRLKNTGFEAITAANGIRGGTGQGREA